MLLTERSEKWGGKERHLDRRKRQTDRKTQRDRETVREADRMGKIRKGNNWRRMGRRRAGKNSGIMTIFNKSILESPT